MATTTYTFTDPDGQKYEVDAPEGATSEQAFQVLQQHLGASSPSATPSPTSAGDYLRNYGKGINTAAAELNRTTQGPLELADAGLGAATAGASWLPGGLDTLVGYVAPGLRDDDNPNNSYRKNASKYIYQPRSEGGAAALQGLGAVLKPIGDAAQFAGDKVGDGLQALGVSPEAAQQAREITPDALSYLAPAATRVGRRALAAGANAGAAVGGKVVAVTTRGQAILDNQIAYQANARKLARREFQLNGGKDIKITNTARRSEELQQLDIGKWITDNPEITAANGTADKLAVVRQLRQRAGQSIGQNDARIDAAMRTVGFSDLRLRSDWMRNHITNSPEYADVRRFARITKGSVRTAYDEFIDEMTDPQTGNLRHFSYDDIASMKRIIDDNIDWQSGEKAANQAYKRFWHVLDDAQDHLINLADRTLGQRGGGLAEQLRLDKHNYSMASKVEEGLAKKLRSPPGQSITSVYRQITGSGRKTAMAGAAAGGLVGSLLPVPYAGATGALLGGTAGRLLSDAKLRAEVRNSQHYTPGPLP